MLAEEDPSGCWIRAEDQGSSPDGRNHQHEVFPKLKRKERLPRACTVRGNASRILKDARVTSRKPPTSSSREEPQYRIITPLVNPAPPSQLERWSLRSMWELASVFNFLRTFRPLLKINVEFSAEELETALISPNSTLDDVHIPLLKRRFHGENLECCTWVEYICKGLCNLEEKENILSLAIPPITRMALGRATWVTVLCRKLRDWWHWVAEGDIPIVASHGTEAELYKTLQPAARVVILKALCDIRVEQEDVRNYIDDSIKHGAQLSMFRHERIGGDAYGTSYWFEDDPDIGHRLYREMRKIETKKFKKGVPSEPVISCQWETVATNLDEFQEVSEKLSSSKNRNEAALGKRLKIDILPDIEKIHKRKGRALKKQHREALLFDNCISSDGVAGGRSLHDRKPVTYTFDDFDRSIDEAIKITKKRQSSPDPAAITELKPEVPINGIVNGLTGFREQVSMDTPSPKLTDNEETDGDNKYGPLDRSNRRRRQPRQYSEFVNDDTDNNTDFDSDEDIMGEAVYDDEYQKYKKAKKANNSSDGDEEYQVDEEMVGDDDEDDEEEEDYGHEDDEDSPSSGESGRSRLWRKPSQRRQETKRRSIDESESGLRRSKRATKSCINYSRYEVSDSEAEPSKPEEPNVSDRQSDSSDSVDYSMESDGTQEAEEEALETKDDASHFLVPAVDDSIEPPPKPNSPCQDEGPKDRRFLDLNELAPGMGFDDGPGDGTFPDENGD